MKELCFHLRALSMQYTPKMINGMESICPISMGSDASKASCISLVYSMRKRKVKIYVRQKPKYQPVPTFSGDSYVVQHAPDAEFGFADLRT